MNMHYRDSRPARGIPAVHYGEDVKEKSAATLPVGESFPPENRVGAHLRARRTPSAGRAPRVASEWADCRRFVNNHPRINGREGATSEHDQRVILDAATGARVVVDHQSWSALVTVARSFNDAPCEVACGETPPL